MKKVVIFQYRLLNYRLALFSQLRNVCVRRGIDFYLVHGQASRRELLKKDEGELHWAYKVNNRFWEFGACDLVWQPYPKELRDADLIIVMQENRILSNYILLLKRYFGGPKVAFWGHGVNFQSNSPSGFRERWKRFFITKVDWWFAYTQKTVDVLTATKYPIHQITCLNNSIDTIGFSHDLSTVSSGQIQTLRYKYNVGSGAPVALYCGSLYPNKRLDILIAACDKIHKEFHSFKLIVIGDGPSEEEIKAASVTRPWLKWVGARKGIEKAIYFRLADVMLNPGAVGLHIIDSFCAGVPIITTVDALHGPEIAYLRNGVNGLIVSGGIAEYANAVINLLRDSNKMESIRVAAQLDAKLYSLENMVNNFADGIDLCLSTTQY